MEEHAFDIVPLLWLAGWLLAVVAVFRAALKLPLETSLGRWQRWLYASSVVIAAVGVCALANVALFLHDGHIDLTREKIYTPSAAAMRVVDALDRDVTVTYFYHSRDPAAQRSREILQVMERRNPRFKLRAVDPDKEPTLARTSGVRIYNAAMIEAEGRRLLVQSTDETEIALGIQRVLRQRLIAICFIEGHGELPMDNFEFHTHLENATDHSHGDASSHVIDMPGHGVGRFRRALEAQGYEARKLILATRKEIPAECTAVIVASPRTTFLPAESAALRAYLQRGGAALFMFDLGFVLEPELERLMAELGVRVEQEVVIDPLSHHQGDPELVAVTGYDRHPVTRSVSLTLYPGVRPLRIVGPPDGVRVVPLLTSSRDSYTRPVQPVGTRVAGRPPAETDAAAAPPVAGPRILGVVVEGLIEGGSRPLRAVAVGDGDFASNSFFPYMANSDLLLSTARWLAREDGGTAVAPRIPVPPHILLTGPQARLVFGLIVVLLPLSVIALGCVVWWRRR
ncbi:GldG family protein [Vineibacter terrae]|uniref:GldG family protein n=1 Tax=Vineibacter terrae TaxID=2586908 RepID=UPI002E301D8D|nr:GldG family protein [Vineibacter terrae]HEX2892287.1 GldG family protein [Vineibacter terrae]